MPTCPTHPDVLLEPKKKGWYCEECDQSVLTYEQLPREASEDPASSPRPGTPTAATSLDLVYLPFPVAHPLAFARDPALGPTERLNNAIFAAYQAMRTAALLMLADYLDVAASDRALEGAIRGLRMPHWGEWTELANKLVLFWSGRSDGTPERPTRFPALVEGWQLGAMERGGDALRPLLEGLPGMQGPSHDTMPYAD